MAKEHQRFNKMNFPILIPFCICVALVGLVQIYQVSGMECDFFDVALDARIMGGHQALREEWPFIAALYLANKSRYFCGGSLISDKHVLTAAHCIQGKDSDEKLSYSDIEVRLGAYNLTVKCEEDAVLRNVTEIYVHPDWNVTSHNYDADLAILVLSDKVTFTEFIQPVSLPGDDVVVDAAIMNISGTIVGWGLAETTIHEEIPRQAAIRSYNDSYCYRTYKGIVELSSARTFCAGSEEGNPSKGDSGGGFYIKTGSSWVQYGIISPIAANETGHVVRSVVAVYTNVQSFHKWIVETIEEPLDAVGNSFLQINLHCTYKTQYSFYTCELNDLEILAENVDVASLTGDHVDGKTDEDVTCVSFAAGTGTMFILPNGVGQFFKNLTMLKVNHGLKTNNITRSNFKNFENLIQLWIERNEIELLQFDTLWDLPALETFRLVYNKLKVLEERTFKKNGRLRTVTLLSNRLEFLPRNLFENNLLLEEVNLSRNVLKNIATDFTLLKSAHTIYLNSNTCIDASYTMYGAFDQLNDFTDLIEFQQQIVSNCSSTN